MSASFSDEMDQPVEGEVLAETESLVAWKSSEEDGDLYHLELGVVTLHLLTEEWDELVMLFKSLT